MDMLWCHDAQDILLSHVKVCPMITMHVHFRLTDRWTDEHHCNSVTIRTDRMLI